MVKTKSLSERLSIYSTRISALDDEALLEELHRARGAHKAAEEGQKDECFLQAQQVEAEAYRRFGLEAERKYRARFGGTGAG